MLLEVLEATFGAGSQQCQGARSLFSLCFPQPMTFHICRFLSLGSKIASVAPVIMSEAGRAVKQDSFHPGENYIPEIPNRHPLIL